MTVEPLLTVSKLEVQFSSERGQVLAVRDVNFHLDQGEVVSVLGESGSGKSVTQKAIIGLIDCPPGRIVGSIHFDGQELVGMSEKQYRAIRGRKIGMVFQDALDALNPTYTIGRQLTEIFRVRRNMGKAEATEAAVTLIDQVGIPDARARLKDYPHQLSGGMRQRVCIAMAIALEPKLLIADEPTTALDVTVQAEILRLLKELQKKTNMAMIFVTHDVSVARLVADRIIVMYAGQIVEEGGAQDVAVRSAHPYTRALLASQPGSVKDWDWHNLSPIAGSPPDKARTITGCPFVNRCPVAEPICATQDPPAVSVDDGHLALCHFAEEVRHGQR
ncbi:MAG: ABC transporter ATP-binding protein [Propionibacteriaceae bacterium]|jgi:peptide/nickel transport system ATP-binding protein/oligopeptide transport system ATP-binding protein|nr:ABC transporter ATP-binding protein [Propionibacteriaceae bacterium]